MRIKLELKKLSNTEKKREEERRKVKENKIENDST
jgi:hypothetical protein